jgi:endo-1,4-beta-xylanase
MEQPRMITRRNFLHSASYSTLAASLPMLRGQQGTPSPATEGLKDLVPAPVLVGAVADQWQMQDARWLKLILANFNLITLGKLKLGFVRPSENTFNFSESDWMVAFCRRHQLAMHGHNLCWDANNPAWLAPALNNKQNAEKLLTSHITTLMKRYAGAITSWDVVNEPIAVWMGRPDGLYKGPWLDALGPEYIDIAFHAAAEADPQPLRVLNIAHVEQGGSGDDASRKATLQLVEALMKRKVPVQAIGFESHLAGDYSVADTASRSAFLRELRQFGLKIMLTEFDVDDTRLPADVTRRDLAVSDCYHDYLASILNEAQPGRIIFFTPSDQRNWYDAIRIPRFVRNDGAPHRPGLFDAALQPKQAYVSVASALKSYRS